MRINKDRDQIVNELGIKGANQAQLEAITFQENRPVLVLAGPGSGKTFVITHRIQFLTQVLDIPPEKILAITFTRDAAISMKKRYLSLLHDKQKQALHTVNFGTFHSILYHVLQQSIHFPDRKMLTEADKRNLLLPIVKKHFPDLSYVQKNNQTLQLINAIGIYKNCENIQKAKICLSQEMAEAFHEIFFEYEKSRLESGKYDYDDIITDVRDLLKSNRDMREYWKSRFQSILIDEFQDVNPAQYDVIRLLAQAGSTVFVVGDDDQAIYGFRGTDPNCMRKFADEFLAKKIILDINYRSMPEIVKASSKMITENKNRFIKKMKSVTKEFERQSDCFKIQEFHSAMEEMEFLIASCRKHLKSNEVIMQQKKENVKQMAIMFRTNKMMSRAAMRLKKAHIPFHTKENISDPYHKSVALDLFAYLKLIAKEGTAEDLFRIINKPSRYISRNFFSDCLEKKKQTENNGFCLLEELIKESEKTGMEAAERLSLLKKQLKKCQSYMPFPLINYIMHVIGYDRWIKENYDHDGASLEEIKELVDLIMNDAKEQKDLKEWIKNWGTENSDHEPNLSDDQTCEIQLMTIHAAKGLEFDKVLIPHCNERIYPHGNMQDLETIEEERRIFYVGMTRAKEELELTYVTGKNGRMEQASRFLRPLQ